MRGVHENGGPRRIARTLAPFVIAPLVALHGCLTQQLWLEGSRAEPRVVDELVGSSERRCDGVLLASEPVIEHGLWWLDGSGDAAARPWWLYPPGWERGGAEVAAALLADGGLCTVLSADVDARRRQVIDDAAENVTWLELELRVTDGAVGGPVPVMQVPPAAARALARDRDELLLAVELEAHLPAAQRRSASQLAPFDLRAVAGAHADVHADGWVFVDADGRPAAPTEEAGLAAADAPLGVGLARLRELTLLVRVRSGASTAILRLRPDRLWLASKVERDGERCVHRSRWFLQSAPRAFAEPPCVDAAGLAASLRLHEERYRRLLEPPLVDGGLLAKIALTPLTLAMDIAFGPAAADFVRWLSGRSARPVESERRGR